MRSRAGKVRLKSSREELLAAGILLDESAAAGRMDLAEVFGNRHPVEVEIGPGKGGFLLRRAAARPEINLLGIEWVPSHAWYAADRARRAALQNVRLVCADAETVFSTCLTERSVWRVHIYFPDPWPKLRHRRRRLIKPSFVAALHRVLQLGGWLGIVTDHVGYFRQIRWVFCQQRGLAEVPFPAAAGRDILMVGTNFERKYRARGRPLYTIAAIRCA